MGSTTPVKHMNLTNILEEDNGLRLGLILLNGARGCDCIERRINHFWKKSDIKVCADGAANRLMLIESNENFIPDIICGDFDSIDETVARKKFDEQHTEFVKIKDQDSTDFTKCINILKRKADAQVKTIVTIGGLCGRFDHVLGCMQTLYEAHMKIIPHLPVFLVHNENFVCIIPKGKNILNINRKFCTGKCGLVPFGFPARQVTTTGLRWNLNKQHMEFGGLVSTCNELDGDEIHVDTDTPLLWTMELI